MKSIMIASAVAAMSIATPAFANDFSGVRAELTAGVDDVTRGVDTTDVTYGVTLGVDLPVTSKAIVGVEANVDNVFDRRDIGASARVGYIVNKSTLVYAKGGYANYEDAFSRKLDGLRVGGGFEYKISNQTYIGAEYRYSDFDAGVGKHGVLAKLGIRF